MALEIEHIDKVDEKKRTIFCQYDHQTIHYTHETVIPKHKHKHNKKSHSK